MSSQWFAAWNGQAGRDASNILDFAELRDVVGFNDYYAEEERYKQQ
jgi:hypothetical protein